jgi:hypothetical protein
LAAKSSLAGAAVGAVVVSPASDGELSVTLAVAVPARKLVSGADGADGAGREAGATSGTVSVMNSGMRATTPTAAKKTSQKKTRFLPITV